MSQLFYAHLVPLDDSVALLDQYQLNDVERESLEKTILSIYHHHIIDIILKNIAKEHHDQIIEKIAENPHNLDVMIYVKSLNPQIEEHIMSGGKELDTRVRAMLHVKNAKSV